MSDEKAEKSEVVDQPVKAAPTVVPVNLEIEEIGALLGAAMQLPQARASKEYRVTNNAIMKLQQVLQGVGAKG